jgi:hypothetical protein
MNGNYEFVKHVAREKQSGFINEARAQRLAKQTGSRGGDRLVLVIATRTGAWLHRVAFGVAQRAADKYATWKAEPHRAGTAGH